METGRQKCLPVCFSRKENHTYAPAEVRKRKSSAQYTDWNLPENECYSYRKPIENRLKKSPKNHRKIILCPESAPRVPPHADRDVHKYSMLSPLFPLSFPFHPYISFPTFFFPQNQFQVSFLIYCFSHKKITFLSFSIRTTALFSNYFYPLRFFLFF